jgi:hypothetical protein
MRWGKGGLRWFHHVSPPVKKLVLHMVKNIKMLLVFVARKSTG